jgi:hypothetical protein
MRQDLTERDAELLDAHAQAEHRYAPVAACPACQTHERADDLQHAQVHEPHAGRQVQRVPG